jgi:spore maturation protein CgeB
LRQIPRFDTIFTYGGGDPVVQAYEARGARYCVPIYNALDPQSHFPVPASPRFSADLAFLGNRLPDREARVEEFFLRPAEQLPELTFLLGGAGWGDKSMTPNVRYLDHVSTRDHNAFNSSAITVLNVTRESMARFGFSPATRVFEAAGAAACLITDAWPGIEMFFEPGCEILVAASGAEVVEHVRSLTPAAARQIGRAAFRRVLMEHTYSHRAAQIDELLDVHPVEKVAVAV